MSRVLFLNQPAMGHFNPLLAIALQMRDNGHEVHFLIPGDERSAFGPQTAASLAAIARDQRMGVDLIWPAPSMLLPALRLPYTTGYDELALSIDLFSSGIAHYTKRILKVVEQRKPDILVADFTMFAAHIAADVMDIPYVVIYHSGLPFRGEIIPPFGSGLPIGEDRPASWAYYEQREQVVMDRLDHRVNRVREHYGLPPLPTGLLRYPYSRWLNLATTVEAIEAPRENLGNRTLYIGPCISKRKHLRSDFPFEQLQNSAYKVYVSLGTVFNNRPQVFQTIIAALDDSGYQLVISAGRAYRTLVRQGMPDHVLLFPSIPQVDVLPYMDLVIGHGGNNSTNETLTAGRPMIVIPVGGEQGDNASRVEYLKVGRRLSLATLDERHVRETVEDLQKTTAYRARALELKQAISLTDGPQTASDYVSWIARHRQPVGRQENSPLTVAEASV